MPNLKAFSHLSEVITDAIALAIVIFAISISMGKLLAKKHDYEVDANQVSDSEAWSLHNLFHRLLDSLVVECWL